MCLSTGCSDGSDGYDDPITLSPQGYVNSDGYRIYYEVIGSGPPLVLVHGWSSNIDLNWKQTGWMDRLASLRTVVAIDVRGHGYSDKPRIQSVYSYSVMAGDVLSVMDALKLESADFVGYSLGAFSGAWLLGHHAHRFSSAVLMGIGDEDAASIQTATSIAAALRADSVDDIVDAEALIYRLYVDLDARNDREALALATLQMWPEGFPRALGGSGLAAVAAPVLILNGDADVPYVATDQLLADAIPSAMLIEIPQANHFSVLFDQRFQNEVINFLAR
ncbi:MAG: alpha/beta hydrolase [Pseudomonadota bacterium]